LTGDDDGALIKVRSPIVGTFYEAPSPDADPFVNVGDQVSPGQPLCIIEAMKMLNEIEADVSGIVVSKKVKNAQAVDYNQVLFEIRPL
jgi:acetyl-CoA carboxylase biotin carboxyl carrier protein